MAPGAAAFAAGPRRVAPTFPAGGATFTLAFAACDTSITFASSALNLAGGAALDASELLFTRAVITLNGQHEAAVGKNE